METNLIALCILLVYSLLIIINTFVMSKKTITMGNNTENKGVINTLLTAAAIIGGAWFVAKLFEKKVPKYSCPNCSSDIDYHQEECQVCRTPLNWDF